MRALVARLIGKGINKSAKWLMSKGAKMSLKGNNKKLYDFYSKQVDEAGKIMKNNKFGSETYKSARRTQEVALDRIENLFKDVMKGNP